MIITADAIDGTIERREFFAREEGREEGRMEGRIEGRMEGHREIIESALRKGSAPESIADVIGISLDKVLEVQQSIKGELAEPK